MVYQEGSWKDEEHIPPQEKEEARVRARLEDLNNKARALYETLNEQVEKFKAAKRDITDTGSDAAVEFDSLRVELTIDSLESNLHDQRTVLFGSDFPERENIDKSIAEQRAKLRALRRETSESRQEIHNRITENKSPSKRGKLLERAKKIFKKN